jgi:hypothetical protein
MNPPQRAETAYRLSSAHVLRLVGPIAVLLGLAWVVCSLAGLARAWTVGIGAVSIAAAVVGAYLFMRPPRILTLTADGYRIGLVRGAGRAGASWREVESVGTADTASGPAMVFRLADGGRSVLPLSLLGPRKVDAQREVHERLNSAFGYRPL